MGALWRICVASQNLIVFYGVFDFLGIAELGRYGLGYAAVTTPGSEHERCRHDKSGCILGQADRAVCGEQII